MFAFIKFLKNCIARSSGLFSLCNLGDYIQFRYFCLASFIVIMSQRGNTSITSQYLRYLVYVAAHLRSLRADDSTNKGHPRPIKQEINYASIKLISGTVKLMILLTIPCTFNCVHTYGHVYIRAPTIAQKYEWDT